MRSFLLLFLLANFISAESHNASGVLELAVANLPPCALQCALTTVGKSTCELTDINCIKTNKELQHDLSVCIKASCRIREALTAKKFLLNLAGAPIRDNTKLGTVTCLVVGCLAVLAYLLRVVARLPRFGAYWGPDDWVITAATIVSIPMTVCAEILNHLAFGKDIWEVPFDNITKVLKIFYFLELLYLTAIGLTKISILLFYLRIFPQKKLRRAICITIVLCVLYIIGFVTATALQCIPVHISWERWDGEHHGRCFNLNAGAWASAGVNIVLDLIVILLPTRQVAKLSMSRRRRLGVMIMFLLGGFVTVVSVLRLKYMVEFAHTQNVTWDYMPIGVWSAVETHVGLVVACMPAMRSLLRSLRDRRSPRPPASTGYYEDGTRDSNKKNSRKNERSLFSLLSRSNVDNEDFVELGEGVTGSITDCKGAIIDSTMRNGSASEKSRAQSFNSNEDIQPLAARSAPAGRAPAGGIVVQTEYSVERTSLDLETSRQKLDAN